MAKTHKRLMERAADFENLSHAFRQAVCGHRRQAQASRMFFNLESDLLRLREELLSGSYRFGRYQSFVIHDPKSRTIKAAPFRDRVVHHAVCNVIEPIFDRGFIYDSYACRTGKGTMQGVLRLHAWVKGDPGAYVLHCDIAKYFNSVDHDVLLGLLARRIADKRLLALLADLVTGGASSPGKGIPIGNLTSQLFANIYLDPLDHFVKERSRVRHYIRYVDDFLCLGSDKDCLWKEKEEIEGVLNRLKLSFHPKKARVYPVKTGVPFLGVLVSPGGIRILGERLERSVRGQREALEAWRRGEIGEERYLASLESRIAHAEMFGDGRLARKLGWA